MRTEWRTVRVPLLLAAVFLASVTSIHVAPPGSDVASWWPAAGLAAALVIGTDVRRWPHVLIALSVVTGLANAVGGRDPAVCVCFGLANAVEALVVSTALGAHRTRPHLRSAADLARLCAAALAGSAVIGLLAGTTVTLLLDAALWPTTRTVLAAHLASQLVILPLVLSAPEARRRAGWDPRAGADGLLAAAFAVGTFAAVFGLGSVAALAFLPLPALVWTALVLPRREVAGLVVALGLLVTLATAQDLGPLAVDRALSPQTVGALSQLYLVVLFFVSIPLVLLVEQRTSALAVATAVLDATTANAIIGSDPHGVIRFFNVGAERMLGWSAGEVVGGMPGDFYLDRAELAEHNAAHGVADGVPGFRELLARQDGSTQSDWTWRRKDGSTLVVSATVTTIHSPGGDIEGYLSVASDVTQRLEVKRRLRESLAREHASVVELERVDRLKTEFVAAVSHELRTPLTTILGSTELLGSGLPGPLSDRQALMVDRMHRNGRRLLMLIEDLLTLTSVESRAAVRTHDVPATELLDRVAGQAEDLVTDRALDVTVEDRAPGAWIRADADEIERALLGLVSNAVKFTPDGGRVSVVASVEDRDLVWTVSDTGMGISAEDREHLFERFFRSSTAIAQAIQGTGLGLSIVRLIAEAHGGSVCCVLDDGPGTTFELRLPLADRAPAPPEPSPVEVA